MSELILSLQQHCRYMDEILGDNDVKPLRNKALLFLTKQLDPNEEYFHVEGGTIWRTTAWRKSVEKDELLRKQAAEDNAKLDLRKQAYHAIAKGISDKIKGLEINLIYKLAEKLLNDNNVGGAWYFTDGKVDLTKVPPLPFPKYTNLETGTTFTS